MSISFIINLIYYSSEAEVEDFLEAQVTEEVCSCHAQDR